MDGKATGVSHQDLDQKIKDRDNIENPTAEKVAHFDERNGRKNTRPPLYLVFFLKPANLE